VWVCVCVRFVLCASFGNMCTCVFCIVCTVFFVLFRLCICFVVLSVLPPSDN
jgi:hypothetical protein